MVAHRQTNAPILSTHPQARTVQTARAPSSTVLHTRHCHILGGFNTDMNGELNVAGFEAGLFGNDFGFELLLEVILDFHLGKAFTTAGLLPPGTGHFDPEDVLVGYERGVACKVNVIQGWDFWEAAPRPVTELREEYGIPALPGPVLLPPPEAMETPPPHPHT